MRSRPTSNYFNSPSPRPLRRKRTRTRLQVWKPLLLIAAIGFGIHQVHHWLQRPDAVLVLGGAPDREVFAAAFAREHPDLPIWVSSGSNPEYTEWVFSEAGISPDRLHLDYRAGDTVTNFTTLVDDFKAQGMDSIYVITSDYHMRRAKIIGEIVLGSRGIDFKPIAVPSEREPETLSKAIRDGARAMLWVMTGSTGESIGQFLTDLHPPHEH
jgi:uncharacterized SAM-binding protein YcdF (DUF218 family)